MRSWLYKQTNRLGRESIRDSMTCGACCVNSHMESVLLAVWAAYIPGAISMYQMRCLVAVSSNSHKINSDYTDLGSTVTRDNRVGHPTRSWRQSSTWWNMTTHVYTWWAACHPCWSLSMWRQMAYFHAPVVEAKVDLQKNVIPFSHFSFPSCVRENLPSVRNLNRYVYVAKWRRKFQWKL